MSDINNTTPISIEQPTATPKPITSIDQINKIIRRKDIAYASHYAIPSLKKEIPFNEINTSQQKRLVKSVLDSPVYNTEFIYTFREILKENCQDDTVNIDDLTIVDKLVLALGLRMKSIGDKIDVEIQTKDGKTVSIGLEASKILQMALTTINDIPSKIFEDKYYQIECSVPTIGIEYGLERELRNKLANIEIEDIEELRQTVGDAFIGEIVKYVNKVSIKEQDDNKLTLIEWQQFKFADRIKVIETFKTGLLKDILDYINVIRKEIDKIELINFEFGGEKYERRLTIDGNFFTIS
ncbi:MAG: hypothetical protein WC905_05255 [Patescibacteria group bacterium]|jgi:hypothetical protein